MNNILPQIALLLVLLWLSSLFSGSETALFSLKPYHIRELQRKPSRRSLMVSSLLTEPYHLLIAILIGNTLVNVAASSIGTNVVGRFVKHGAVGVSVFVMTALILLFGEIIPKTLAVNNPKVTALRNVPIVSVAVGAFMPLRVVLDRIVRFVLEVIASPVRTEPGQKHAHVSEAIDTGRTEGVLDKTETDMLGGIVRLMNLSVQNIMTPRTEVFMLSSAVKVKEAINLVRSSGYSRIPVFDHKSRDRIVGILYAKDLLYKRAGEETPIAEIVRDPLFVPESKTLIDLLQEFVSGKAHFAVVIDEYGSFTGIVTLDDILAEVIGRDIGAYEERYRFRRKSRNEWEVSGRMEIEYLNALTGSGITNPKAETIGGYILNHLGRIPEIGEEVTIDNLKFKIVDADKRRIITVLVQKRR